MCARGALDFRYPHITTGRWDRGVRRAGHPCGGCTVRDPADCLTGGGGAAVGGVQGTIYTLCEITGCTRTGTVPCLARVYSQRLGNRGRPGSTRHWGILVGRLHLNANGSRAGNANRPCPKPVCCPPAEYRTQKIPAVPGKSGREHMRASSPRAIGDLVLQFP